MADDAAAHEAEMTAKKERADAEKAREAADAA